MGLMLWLCWLVSMALSMGISSVAVKKSWGCVSAYCFKLNYLLSIRLTRAKDSRAEMFLS